MSATPLVEPVSELMREVARTVILPVFGTAEIFEKSPGDLVTEADRASEDILTARLPELYDGSRVIGEEAAHADPRVLDGIADGAVWVVDPLDGTNNFAAGRRPFAMMVALLQDDRCLAGWILDPLADVMWWAQESGGAWCDGDRVAVAPRRVVPAAELTGRASVSGLPRGTARHIDASAGDFASLLPGLRCAGAEYPAVMTGEDDFVVFGRTQPWDHLAGVLFAQEAGGVALRPDGSEYRASTHSSRGLVVARDEATYAAVRDVLFPQEDPQG